MKQLLQILFLLGVLSQNCFSQSTNCGDAVLQLQNYAAQVNQIYSNEYWTIIPNLRCPAFNQWGQPFNPVMVQNCRIQMLGNLNNWYGQQSNYVNNAYAQIARGCTNDPNSTNKPAPPPVDDDSQNTEIDTDQIEELTAGIDEEKAVKIKIPKTAAGFKPKN